MSYPVKLLVRLLVTWAIEAAALIALASFLPGLQLSRWETGATAIVAIALLNALLRPLIPQYGQLAAYPASNILIISDRANNVNRIIRIIRRIDQVGDQDVEVIPLHDASSAEIVRVINSLYQGQQAAEGGQAAKVVADERSSEHQENGNCSSLPSWAYSSRA